jgi:catechol 2,3-dioxygenase-like lactoylglutathione lyase family enzyme
MNLNHVHLGTKDLEVFLNFYERFFGFKKKFDHGKGAFLYNSSNFLIAVDPVETLPTFPEWYHLGFCLDSENEVLDIYEKMKLEGVNIVRELLAEKGEFASFYLIDPDGNKLEISWHND